MAEVLYPTDPQELAKKLMSDLRAELKTHDDKVAPARTADTVLPALPADMSAHIQKQIADMLAAKEAADVATATAAREKAIKDQEHIDAKVLEALSKVGLERKGDFIATKAGGPIQMDYKSMLNRPAFDDETKGLQKLNDDVFILSVMLKRHPSNFMSPMGRQMAAELKHRSTQWCQTKANALYATGTDVGDEWVPTGFSSTLYEWIDVFGMVEPHFESFVMPTNPYTDPIQEALPTAYLAGEPTDAGATKLVASTPTTGNQTYTAKTLAVRVPYSYDFAEDSIIAALPNLRTSCAKALSKGGENVIINGQATSSIDVLAPCEGTAGDAIPSNDARKAADGLRAMAILAENASGVDTKLSGSTGALTYELTSRVKARMAEFAADLSMLRWFSGIAMAEQIYRLDECRTMDKYGDNATIVKGETAKLRGVPLVITGVMNEAQNASGVYDNTTKTTCSLLLCNISCFKIANRRDVTIETDKNIETQQHVIVATRRMDFKPRGYTPMSETHGHTPVGLLYDVLTDSAT